MTIAVRYVAALADGLRDWGVEAMVYVPSSHCAPLIRALLEDTDGVLANREDEATAIAGGMALAGRKTALVIQDNGFGNALTTLTTFAQAYHIGFPVVANARGGIGEYNSMIQWVSGHVPAILAACELPLYSLEALAPPAVWRATTAGAAQLAVMQRRPAVIRYDAMHPAVTETPATGSAAGDRHEAH